MSRCIILALRADLILLEELIDDPTPLRVCRYRTPSHPEPAIGRRGGSAAAKDSGSRPYNGYTFIARARNMFRYEQDLVTLSQAWPRSGVRQPLKAVCRTCVGLERATALRNLHQEETNAGSVQIQSPRHDCRQEPSATMLKGFSASIPQIRHLLPALRPVQKVAAQRCNWLAAVGRLAVQTVIDEPLAGRLLSAQSGWRITSYSPCAASTGIRSEASKGRI